MRKFLGVVTAITILATGVVAQAAQQGGSATGATGATAGRPQSGQQTFTFTDELVQASLVRPDGVRGTGGLHIRGHSLLRIRLDFVPEMLKSIERL